MSDIFQARGHFFKPLLSMDGLLDFIEDFEID